MDFRAVSPSGWTFVVVMTLVFPLLAIRSAQRVRRPGGTPNRSQHLTSVFVSQAMMLVLALIAMDSEHVALLPHAELDWREPVSAAVFLAVTLGTLPMRWRWKPREERARNLWMLPTRTSDLGWWAVVALVAGVVEELVYRGVLFTLWQRALGSWWAATAVCSAAFALVHFVQAWRAVVAIALFAVGSHTIVRLTGDLYTVIAVHIVYDFVAGVLLIALARRDGLLADPRPAT